MGNELYKIEQNGNQIAKHPRISEGAGQQLQEEVKVCRSCLSWYCHSTCMYTLYLQVTVCALVH